MINQMELAAEERAVLGKQVARLRRQGIVPANVYGLHQPSVSLQVDGVALQKLLARGGNNVILLKIGDQPAVQVLIKRVQRNHLNDKATHVDFHRVAASEALRARVQLHFVGEADVLNLADVTVSHALSEVMVQCLPADLPSRIDVDLSQLKEVGAVIRVENLVVGPGVTVVTDPNETVARVRQRGQTEQPEAPEAVPATAKATATSGNEGAPSS